MEDTIS